MGVGGLCGRGAFLAEGVCGWGRAWQGVCMVGEGACVAEETATAVGGRHPTGMHSCFRHIYNMFAAVSRRAHGSCTVEVEFEFTT